MAVRYEESLPPAHLVRWVECCWTVSATEPLLGYPVRPDGCLDIIYSRESGLRAVGAMTAEQRYDLPAASQMAGVRFRPGMAGRFLRAAPAELTDLTVALEELWGVSARELTGRLDQSPADHCARLMMEHLPPTAPLNPVQRAVEAIVQADGEVDLEHISRHANLSPRQFRRRCLEETGLTPKRLCRVLRFRYALGLAGRVQSPEWPAIAAEAGYFDQAHLIRDFREFTGQTPMAVFSNTRKPLPR